MATKPVEDFSAQDKIDFREAIGAGVPPTTAQGAPVHPAVPISGIGQMCRVGDSAPYTWYRAETLTNWVIDGNASSVSFTPTGDIQATNVQGALTEVADSRVKSNVGAVGKYLGMLSGPPASGYHKVGDFCNTYTGDIWTCICNGNPGIWHTGSQDLPENELFTPPCNYAGTRVYPARFSGNRIWDANNRMILVTYPLSSRVAIDAILIKIEAAGEAGSIIDVGIYEDNLGTPKKLLATGSVSVASVGNKTIDLSTPVGGGKWIWVGFLLRNAPSSRPWLAFADYSPYWPMDNNQSPYLNQYSSHALYFDYTTGLPTRFFEGGNICSYFATHSPMFGMRFITPPGLKPREPDRHLALGPSGEDFAEDQNCLQEPNVYYDASRIADERYVMTYTSGWGDSELAWATAPHPTGPWTKKGVFLAGALGKSSLHFEAGTLYVYTPGASMYVQTGTAPDTLGDPVVCMAPAVIANAGGYQNSNLLKRGTNDYVMFVECNWTGGGPAQWKTGKSASASSPLGPFVLNTFPILGLNRGLDVMVGGPCCTYIGGIYKLWYHRGETGNEPTEIYSATSTDMITWTESANPVVKRVSHWEIDQVADPHYFLDPVSGVGYLYWDALDNQLPRSVIMVSNPNKLPITAS